MKTMKKSKVFIVVCCLLMTAVLICGCGAATTGDAPITSKWKLKEYTVNGKTTVIADQSLALRIFSAKDNPSFQCKDGVNCTFTNLRKARKGTVTQEDGKYIITYDNTSVKMIGEIHGNTLTLVNDKGTLELIFETK